MKRTLLIITLLFLAACTASTDGMPTQKGCQIDSDCVCGGMLKEGGDCFVGNKEWSEGKVDFSLQCPDFCSGIAGNMETKCVKGSCEVVVQGEAAQNTQCVENSDCIVTGCSGHICKPASEEQKSPTFTTCEWTEAYGCVKKSTCGCFAGTCRWDQTHDYVQCLQKAQEDI